jgi:hypothetical protein
MLFFNNPSKSKTWALWGFLSENYLFFEMSISTIQYNYLFYMTLKCDMLGSRKLSHGMLIEF